MTLIRVADVETTGLDDPAEMVEIGWTDVHRTFEGWKIESRGPSSFLVNPGIPIGFGAMAAHHIRPEMVAGGLAPDDARAAVADGADILCAHNWAFDNRFLKSTVPGICTFKAARTIWPNLQSHKNGSIRYEFDLCPFDERATPAHRAGPDTWVTAHILLELLKECDVDRLIDIAKHPLLERKVGFGEHEGKPWSEVPDSYIDWILNKSKMASDPRREDTVFTARTEFEKRQASRSEPSGQGEQQEQLSDRGTPYRERKGARLAQRSAIMCTERGFWSFIKSKYAQDVASGTEAADWLRNECGVGSRADLDHNERASGAFEAIDRSYRLWLEGYD